MGEPGWTALWNSFSCWARLEVTPRALLPPPCELEPELAPGAEGTAMLVTWSSSRSVARRRRARLASELRLLSSKRGGPSCAEVGM